jgi:peptidoglycan hydrolase-like protein with peptidoglycan-binding domain
MRQLHRSLTLVFVGAAFVAGCAGAPETNSGATGASPSPAPSRPAPPPSPPPRMPPQDMGVNVDGMTVFELQERLNELGYKVGTVDGVMGPRTVDALKKYQGDNKINASGTVDADTIKKLRAAIK